MHDRFIEYWGSGRMLIMTTSVAAKQAKGKHAQDVIFSTSEAASKATEKYGRDKVVNGTVGAINDEDGNLVFLKTVEEVYRNLPAREYSAYAPIAGLPEYLEAAIGQCFGQSRPEGHIEAVATSGGTGVLHHMIQNYTEPGDEVLTSDWFWGAYSSICDDNGRKLRTYQIFTEDLKFNHAAFQEAVRDMASKQTNVAIIINSPAHNPTGFSLTDEDWDQVLAFLKEIISAGKNNVILDVDVAYLDYSAPKEEARRFFRKFGNLPPEILVIVGYTMSKSYTIYGQRVGAMIAVTPSAEIAQEFHDINQYTSRATWSSICRPAMRTMVVIANDPEKQAVYEAERNHYYELIKERAEIFMAESEECGLTILPYQSGFFISIPTPAAKPICDELKKEEIYLIPLKKGIRVAICGMPKARIRGLAKRIHEVMQAVEKAN